MKGLVIAGNYTEYIDWIKEKELNHLEYKYISSSDDFRGHHKIKVYRIGQYWTNPVYEEIKNWVDDAWWLI